MPEMDYRKLIARMVEKGYTQRQLSKELGTCESQLSLKLNGKYAFRQCEIAKICEVLEIAAYEIGSYFFTPKVVKPQQI